MRAAPVTLPGVGWYMKHMKRTNLVLREDLLQQAVSLEDFVRRAKARKILELRGSWAWEGSLGEMRRDQKARGGRRS